MEPESAPAAPPKRFLLRLRTVFIITAAVALVAGLATIALWTPTTRARKTQCTNNLKQLGLALLSYEAARGSMPPAFFEDAQGRRMHSWRVCVEPYIQSPFRHDFPPPHAITYDFSEPWDGPSNRTLHGKANRIYRCPSDPSGARTDSKYLAVVGPRTAWPGPALWPPPSRRPSATPSTKDFAAGGANTILLVEVADSGIHWMEPRDLEVGQFDGTINAGSGQGISSHHGGGANVVFADGSIRFLSSNTSPEVVKALLTTAGGEMVSADDLP
jgi:prepilin-type processing-associated H-X9-DG protein